jgi:hypothetical protein
VDFATAATQNSVLKTQEMYHIMNLFHNSVIKEESHTNVMFLSCSGFLMKGKLVL